MQEKKDFNRGDVDSDECATKEDKDEEDRSFTLDKSFTLYNVF